jgi:hypothetical protein
MARGQTLESILNKVRAKARLSLLPAANTQVRDSHVELIKSEQDRLWEDYAWPHLRVHKLIALQSGQRTYSLPEDTYSANDGTYTLTMDRVELIEVRDGGEWVKLHPEITSAHYSTHESELDERSWPATNWKADENDQIEIWPIPDQNAVEATLEGYIRVTGIRSLRTFAADADRADLDDEMLSDYVAASLLAATGAKDAPLRLESANKRYSKLKGKQTKTTSFKLFGTGNRPVRTRPMIRRYVA